MKLRALLLCLLALALASPANAQSGKVYRIGVLETAPASANRANMDALLRGLKDVGYVEGKNIVIDYRSADGRPQRFPELAADLVRARPDIIVTRGTPAALAAKAAGTIPVVMAASADPVGAGIVPSLAHPGGHVTGNTAMIAELAAKRVELLKELIAPGSRIAAIFNMASPNAAGQWKQIEKTARSLGFQATVYDVRDTSGLNRAFAQVTEERVGALLVTLEAVMSANRAAIVQFAAKAKIPVMYTAREFVQAGGLMSYGVHYPQLYYRAASYVDKILKGAKPADLPIEQPTKLNLVINMATARALGISIPRDMLLRADEVIE